MHLSTAVAEDAMNDGLFFTSHCSSL